MLTIQVGFKLALHVMGHFILHAGIGVLTFEDEAMTESSIEAPVRSVREPDEVGRTIVGVVAVKVMTLMVTATRTNPSESNEEMAVRSSDEVAHPRVVGMHVGFSLEVLGAIVLHLIQSSGREGEEDAHTGAIEFRTSLSWNSASTEAEFCAIREEDFLRGR